jgi:hypothetical protein
VVDELACAGGPRCQRDKTLERRCFTNVFINVFIDPYNSTSNKQSTAFKEIQAKLSES